MGSRPVWRHYIRERFELGPLSGYLCGPLKQTRSRSESENKEAANRGGLHLLRMVAIEATPLAHLQAPSKTPRALPMKYWACPSLPSPLKAMPAVR
jgi:hypothetical protein